MKHIVSFSSGLSSAVACERVLKRYDDVDIVFMDTLIEDDDNYRFMRECEARWGVKITILTEGRTPFEVATDKKIIPSNFAAPCTFVLKIEPFVKYLTALNESDLTIHIGYDYMEIHRCEATEKNYAERGWAVDFPLLWKPYEARSYADTVKDDWGIKPPRMYAMGFSHANCGGRCVKSGQSDWLRTLKHFPNRFREIEDWEQGMRNHPVRANRAMLRKQVGGVMRGLPLTELRENYEDVEINQGDLFTMDETSPCVTCDVGGGLLDEEQEE